MQLTKEIKSLALWLLLSLAVLGLAFYLGQASSNAEQMRATNSQAGQAFETCCLNT